MWLLCVSIFIFIRCPLVINLGKSVLVGESSGVSGEVPVSRGSMGLLNVHYCGGRMGRGGGGVTTPDPD